MAAKDGIGILKFIVITMGVVLIVGAGVLIAAIVGKTSDRCIPAQEIRLTSLHHINSVMLQKHVLQVLGQDAEGKHHAVAVNLCDGETLSDTRIILGN